MRKLLDQEKIDRVTLVAHWALATQIANAAGGTHLGFSHWGWGSGADWDKAFDYFDKAWGGFVLPSLQHRIAHGPIDWQKPPSLTPLAGTLKHKLSIVGATAR